MAFTLPVTSQVVDVEDFEAAVDALIEGVATSAAVGYPLATDTTAGLAATTDGQGFSVLGDTGLALYLNDGGSASLQGTVPLSAVTDAIAARVTALEGAGVTGAQGVAGGPVAVATTANITLSGEQTIDGVLTSTSRVLVKDQTAPAENGIYVSAAGAWARATDMDEAGEVVNSAVFVSGGSTQGGDTWATYSTVTTLDTDSIAFVQIANSSGLATLSSPAFTGTPTAPTAASGTDTTQIATTAYVQTELDELPATELVTERATAGQVLFDDDAPVVPIVLDSVGRIALGYDTTTGLLVGGGADCLPNVRRETGALLYPPKFAGYSHVLYYGQSNAAGVGSGTPITTTQPYSHVTFDGGTRDFSSLASFIPLVESTVETGVATACNYAASRAAVDGVAPADFVLIGSSAAQGSQTIAELSKENADDWYRTQLYAQIAAAKAIDSDYSLVAVPWLQGESDTLSTPTDEAVYKAALLQLIADINFDANFINPGNGPVHLLTYQTLVNARGVDNITDAQLSAVEDSPLIHMVTPLYHIAHAPDDTHLTAAGQRHFGGYVGRVIDYLRRGLEPPWLKPISATRRGSEIRVRYDVPTLPLVLDTTDLPETTDYGFAVEDSGGLMTISSVTVDGSDVVITVSGTPSGATEVRYAKDYISPYVPADFPSNGATGNLRDSTTDTIDISATETALWHVGPHLKKTVLELSE